MNRPRFLAHAIASRLESEIPELAGNVVVWRRGDIDSEFKKRMGKTRGKVVVVRVTGAKNESNTKHSYYACTITVTLFMVPTLTAKDASDADEIMAAIDAALHGWFPDTIPHIGVAWLIADQISYIENAQYDVSSITLKTPLMPLANVPLTTPQAILTSSSSFKI